MTASLYDRYRRALRDEALPVAFVDLDAFEANLDALLKPVRQHGKTLRLATKSVRCPALMKLALERGGSAMRGLMTFTAAETAALAEQGFRDLLLAYPTAQPRDAALLAGLNARGIEAFAAVDSEEHVALFEQAGAAAGAAVPLVIDVDVSYRPLGTSLHLGVRRSPLRAAPDVVRLAKRIASGKGVSFAGLMAYEAQIAGLSDASLAFRVLKRLSRPDVEATRRKLHAALSAEGLQPRLFNGAGTGSLSTASAETALTEVAAGSGLLAGHLFDGYRNLSIQPSLHFAFQISRKPAPRIATVLGAGGLAASGEAGPSRLPKPALPEGLQLLPMEGAGEVQTPVLLPPGLDLPLGAPVIFRPAKSGEPLERTDRVLLVRGDAPVGHAPTYRGLGHAFLA
jgi:D-serine deaminase-like pyridoxal phosphate-dependent protein